MNNNENSESKLITNETAADTENSLPAAEGKLTAEEMAREVAEILDIEPSEPVEDAVVMPILEAEQPEEATGVTIEEALNDIRNEMESLERTARIFRSAGKNVEPEEGSWTPESEDDFTPIRTIFDRRGAAREETKDDDNSIFFVGPAGERATLKIESDSTGNMHRYINELINGFRSRDGEKANPSQTKKTGKKKGRSTVANLLLSLLVLGLVSYYILYAHGLRAIASIEELEVNSNAYSMTFSGDYGLGKLLAEGGASTDGELMEFLSRHYSFGLVDMPAIVGGPADSSDGVLSVLNSDCDNSRALTGRSHSCQSQTMTMIVSTRQNSGRESVSTVDIGRLGYTPYDRPGMFNGYAALAAVYFPLDGMNDYGLCVTAVELPGDPQPVKDTERTDLTVTAAVRMLLDYTATVEDAVGMLGKFDIYPSFGCDYHLLISDREGNAAAIEWHEGQMYRVNIPYISNERVFSPDGLTGAADFDTETGRIMTLLAGSYSKYDGHMTAEQLLGVIGRAATRANGWSVVYDPYTDTAYFRFEGETEKQVTVSMSPA